MAYYGFCVTAQGEALIAKLVAGSTLNLLYVMAGDGEVGDDYTPRSMTALTNPILKGTSTTPVVEDSTVSMVLEFKSTDLSESFYLREFGIFAEDPDDGEILFAYGTLGDYPQYMAAGSDTGVDIRRFPVSITIGEGVEVALDWSELAWMTAEDVKIYCENYCMPMCAENTEALIAEHNEDESAHPYLLQLVSGLQAEIDLLKLEISTMSSTTATTTAASFVVDFDDLSDADVTGVWNNIKARIDF